MEQASQKKFVLQLITFVLGMSFLCVIYGIFRFTAMLWYPHNSSIKDLNVEISPCALFYRKSCVNMSSVIVTEDQRAEVGDWYRQQGWRISETPRRCTFWRPLLPDLRIGSFEIGSTGLVSFFDVKADYGVTKIYVESSFCISW